MPRRQIRRQFEQLENRRLLAGVLMHSAVGNGAAWVDLTYEVEAPTSAIELGVYRSTDSLFGAGDVRIDSLTLTDASDLHVGVHSKSLPIGSGLASLGMPGAGASEVASDYYLLIIANPTAPESDGVAVFTGFTIRSVVASTFMAERGSITFRSIIHFC